MYKAKASDVNALIKCGEDSEEISHMKQTGLQPSGHVLAYYMPSSADWSWQIGIYTVNGKQYELLTRFGSVEGGREVYQYDNICGGAA